MLLMTLTREPFNSKRIETNWPREISIESDKRPGNVMTIATRKGGPNAGHISVVLTINARRSIVESGNELSFQILCRWLQLASPLTPGCFDSVPNRNNSGHDSCDRRGDFKAEHALRSVGLLNIF
jgi:hypothetical protein